MFYLELNESATLYQDCNTNDFSVNVQLEEALPALIVGLKCIAMAAIPDARKICPSILVQPLRSSSEPIAIAALYVAIRYARKSFSLS